MLLTGTSTVKRYGRVAAIAVSAFLCFPTTSGFSSDDDSSSSESEYEKISESLVDPLNPFGDQQDLSNGNKQNTCQILIVNPGILRPNIESYVLSSKELGGRASTVNVTATNSSYTLSIDTPLGFTAMPAGGANDVSMTTSFSGTGATNFTDRPGKTGIRLKNGDTLVEAHLTAKRQLNNPFPSGHYSAEITMRCE